MGDAKTSRKFKNPFSTHSNSILSGIFIGTSYIPFPPWASLFCFVPLWSHWTALSKENEESSLTIFQTAKKIFISGWIAQFLLTLIGFNWVTLTVHEFGHMPWALAVLTLFFFCSIANLDLPLSGVLWFMLHKKLRLPQKHSLVVLAIITALLESRVPTLFPWNYGYPWFWIQAPVAQTAELIGFQGLSSVIVLLNLGTMIFWQEWKAQRRPAAAKILATTLGLFISLNLGGWLLKISLPSPDSEVRVLITQANIGNLEKQYAEKGWGFRSHIFDRYSTLTRDGAQNNGPIDVIVWPETAYPYEMDQRAWSLRAPPVYPISARQLLQLAEELKTPIITGGYGIAPTDGKVTNTFFIVENTQNIQPHPYYKTILLAFGEYIPGAKFFPKLKKWIPAGDFSHGLGPQVQKLKIKSSSEDSPRELLIGPQICYESLFPSFFRSLAQQRSEIFINLTNDSWYGTWQEPYQHLSMTLARAIEYRRPLIRSTNTGISTAVTAKGEVMQTSPLGVEWTGVFNLPYKSSPPPTIYQKYPWLIEVLLIIMLLFVLKRSWIAKRT